MWGSNVIFGSPTFLLPFILFFLAPVLCDDCQLHFSLECSVELEVMKDACHETDWAFSDRDKGSLLRQWQHLRSSPITNDIYVAMCVTARGDSRVNVRKRELNPRHCKQCTHTSCD